MSSNIEKTIKANTLRNWNSKQNRHSNTSVYNRKQPKQKPLPIPSIIQTVHWNTPRYSLDYLNDHLSTCLQNMFRTNNSHNRDYAVVANSKQNSDTKQHTTPFH